MSGEEDFFSVARTMSLVARIYRLAFCIGTVVRRHKAVPLIPNDVTPWLTALRAYSICTSLPLGEKVVSENEYLSAMAEELQSEYCANAAK